MKTAFRTTIILIITLFSMGLKSQTMEETLTKTMQQLDTATTLPDFMSACSQFDLAAGKWSDQWITNYYAAYAKAISTYHETDAVKKDQMIDDAEKNLATLKTLKGDSSETYVLAALLINARVAVDGKNRGAKYGSVFSENLTKAKAINPENPRIYYLKGVSLFYTPKMFGGGTKKAKEYFDKATPLFEKENKTSILIPHWGAKENAHYLSECDK
jgi:hypothetical protein